MKPMISLIILSLLASALASDSWAAEKGTIDVPKLPSAASRPVDFTKEVRPIFEAACYQCHGPEKQKSDFRLDVKSLALKGGEHGQAIIPGRSAESPLIHFVAGVVADMKMPVKGEPLSREQIGLLRAWIDQGALWPEDAGGSQVAPATNWWSLQPVVRPALPKLPSADLKWVRTSIDPFILAKLHEKGLAPSPEADRRTLIRRLYFDLVGLPPTPEEIAAFLTDPDPKAYENLVDRLLASPHYGERWARHWLDVVHYGDTHGYDKDKQRPNAWPYRDYVIRALNDDKPYVRFVEEQIAGDALFPGTRDGIVALGFIAAGPWDAIGHFEVPETKIDGKIARHLDRDDMVANTIGTFASTTIHCAQCHNHKFDPFSQEDYYSLQAVFAALDRADKKFFADPALTQRFNELEARQRKLADRKTAIEKQAEKAAGGELVKLDAEIASVAKNAGGNARPEFGYHSLISKAQDTVKWVQVDLGGSILLDKIVLQPCFDNFNNIGAGFGFPLRYKIEVCDDPEFKVNPIRVVAKSTEDAPNPGTAPQTFTAAGATGRYVRVTALKLAPRQDDYILALAELQAIDSTGRNLATNAPVTALDSTEAPPRWRKTNLVDGLGPEPDRSGELAELKARRAALLEKAMPPTARTERTEVTAEWDGVNQELRGFPKPEVVFAGTVHDGTGNFQGTGANGGKPRPIFLLARGQVTQPGREISPGALAALTFQPSRFSLPPNAPEGERRAALARWITDPQNPLTWRSLVNRVWQYHFGRGLVETPDDFGRNGALPSHPELLDWLAGDFRDRGGSLKQLHRLIVTSATYRQTSGTNADAEKIDANNSLLWRQNRRKLEAEAVRDSVLAASGKLDLTMGGPGWQDFVIEHPEHSPHYEYGLANPEDAKTWRRSIYRFIVRSQTQPWMTSLDCADPSMRVDKRNESLSALQALALLNNGFMVTQSRHFAERVQREKPDLTAQVERAHWLALGGAPSPADRPNLVAFAQAQGLPNLCRVLLNLNAFAFVD